MISEERLDRKEYLLESLRQWLHELGFADLARARHDGWHIDPDLVVRKGDRLLMAEAKVANAYRSRMFPALVGDFILRAGQSVNETDVLIALLVKKMTDNAVRDLESYAQEYLPALNWFLLDESGRSVARIDGRDFQLSLQPLKRDADSTWRGAPRRSLFSPNSQWLLKVLLLPGIGPRYWGGPGEKPGSIVDLANMARVPQSSVSAFISKFEEEGYIRRQEGVPVVVRHRELLDEWHYSARNAPSELVPVKHLYGDSPEALVRRVGDAKGAGGAPDMIVGYHLACHLYGIGRSSVKVGWAYTHRATEQIMRAYDLVEDTSPSPSLWLVSARARAVQGGWVMADDVPVCDILQCYLDVRESKARGEEQAQHILDRILMPHFEGRA
jgi:hypothetical protein